MSNKFKEKVITNRYYFFDNMINIKSLDTNKIMIDEHSYTNVLIYHIGYVTLKNLSYTKINSANLLYLIIDKKWIH